MGKSIRSKRKKRLRTLKREIVEPHYNAKEALQQAAIEAALQAPKVPIPTKKSQMDEEPEYQGRSGPPVPMSIDDSGSTEVAKGLKAKGKIKKRGKSKGRLKKEKHKQKRLNF
ncbi:hypothetical protein GOP47_0019816 [Adiantum capillus-veneris]|uniref:Uncharacterized protein n=1 Tax=Adiantum capillus-veneris TaxID=13818 RepID=A0A9D4UBT3_ADICA|nr:hypothetical protein GOP47_0019816 [Adiantum capillus-veneris]